MSRKYNPDQYHNSKNPLLYFIEKRRTNCILRLLDIQPSDTVLDIGCGAGNMLERIRAKRTGIDLSETMLLRSTKRLGNDVVLQKMSAEALTFDPSTFDKIICSEVIEHILSPEKALSEIARVLKPGGLAAISIPNEALLEQTKKMLRACGLKILMKNDGETNVEDVENEWHLHQASLKKFTSWNTELTTVCRRNVPFFWLPFRYVFLLKKEAIAI